MEHSKQDREILLAALEAGKLLLENGAEIFRVEETIYRICKHFGLTSASAFVLSNGTVSYTHLTLPTNSRV